jgi:hypothetical protein
MSELESTEGGPPAAEAPSQATPAGQAAQATEAEAWAVVLAAWTDEGAHQRYLARFGDIEGLAVAGGRYKGVLDERPGDEVALRMRAEVLRKATAFGLASLPRTTPPSASQSVKRTRLAAALLLGAAAVWCLYKMFALLGAF